MKKPRRKGRPSRAEASKQALAGLDVAGTDPHRVLLEIAANPASPATARVAACRALLAAGGGGEKKAKDGDDAVTALALKLLRGKR